MQADGSLKTIDRAAMLLKLLAASGAQGCRLSDLARQSGFGKTTTHRILGALVDVGFAAQSAQTRRYHLGFEIVRMGATAGIPDLLGQARPSLLRLARDSEDTVYLSLRDDLDAVCAERQEGAYPIKTLTLNVGDRRPLGVGAGSLALLSFLPDEEIREIIESNRAKLAAYPAFSPDALPALVEDARRRGYAFNDGRIVSAMSALGVPVRDAQGRVLAALSIAAIKERMSEERVARLADMLNEEAARLTKRLAGPEA